MKFSLSALLLVCLCLLQVASALYAPLAPLRTSATVRAHSRLSLNMMAEQLGRVTMYKKDGCPFCEKAKTMLENEHGLKIDFVDIEEPDRYRTRSNGILTTHFPYIYGTNSISPSSTSSTSEPPQCEAGRDDPADAHLLGRAQHSAPDLLQLRTPRCTYTYTYTYTHTHTHTYNTYNIHI
jgi:glutaredoxin